MHKASRRFSRYPSRSSEVERLPTPRVELVPQDSHGENTHLWTIGRTGRFSPGRPGRGQLSGHKQDSPHYPLPSGGGRQRSSRILLCSWRHTHKKAPVAARKSLEKVKFLRPRIGLELIGVFRQNTALNSTAMHPNSPDFTGETSFHNLENQQMFTAETSPLEPESLDVERCQDGAVLVRVHSCNQNGRCLPDAVFTFRSGDPQYSFWEEKLRNATPSKNDFIA